MAIRIKRKPQKLGTAHWQDDAAFAASHPFESGKLWLGRSPESGIPVGYGDDRHALVCCGTRSGKGTTVITPNVCLWPGSLVVVDPKGEVATVAASRRGEGSDYCVGMNQKVCVVDPFGESEVDEKYRARFNPLDTIDPDDPNAVAYAGSIAEAMGIIPKESHEPHFDELAKDVIEALILHVLTHPLYKGRRNLVTVRDLITCGDFDSFEILRRENGGDEPAIDSHALLWQCVSANRKIAEVARVGSSMLSMYLASQKQYSSVMASASRHTKFLGTPAIAESVEKSDFALSDLKTDPRGVSVFLTIPDRFYASHKRWLRMMLVLISNEMTRSKRKPVCGSRVLMVIDEFAGLERLETMEHNISKLGGAHVTMMFIVQTLSQLRDIYKDFWETFFSQCGTRVFFSIDDLFTRNYLSEFIGDTEIRPILESMSESAGHSKGRTDGNSESNAVSNTKTTSETKTHTDSTGENVSTTMGRNSQRTIGTHSASGESHQRGYNEGRSEQSGWNTSTNQQRNWSKNSNWGSQEGTGKNATYNQWPIFRCVPKAIPFIRKEEKASLSKNTSSNKGGGQSRGGAEGSSEGQSGSISRNTSIVSNIGHTISTGTNESNSEGENYSHAIGRNTSSSDAVSRGISLAEAITRTYTTNTSETVTDTVTQTATRSESVHKRRLITGDEIGEQFDRGEDGRPADALVLIGGGRPITVRRTPYFSDEVFGWLYDPHPDHAEPPKLIGAVPIPLPPAVEQSVGLSSIRWLNRQGDRVTRGRSLISLRFEAPSTWVDMNHVQQGVTGEMPSFGGTPAHMIAGVDLTVLSPASGTLLECGEGTKSYAAIRCNRRKHWEETKKIRLECVVEEYNRFCDKLRELERDGIERERFAREETERRRREEERKADERRRLDREEREQFREEQRQRDVAEVLAASKERYITGSPPWWADAEGVQLLGFWVSLFGSGALSSQFVSIFTIQEPTTRLMLFGIPCAFGTVTGWLFFRWLSRKLQSRYRDQRRSEWSRMNLKERLDYSGKGYLYRS